MLFTDKERCGAWRCECFSCEIYSETDYDCQEGHCHVCAAGQMCSNCENYGDCEEAAENMKLQRERNGARKRG